MRATPHCPQVLRWSRCLGHRWQARAAAARSPPSSSAFPLPVRLHISFIKWRNSGERKWCCSEWIRQEEREQKQSSLNLFVNTLSWQDIELITSLGKTPEPGEQPSYYLITLVTVGCSFRPIPVTASSFHHNYYQIVEECSTASRRKWLIASGMFYLLILTQSIFQVFIEVL